MNQIKFDTYKKEGVFEYHFFPKDDESIIMPDERFSNNKKLWNKWCEIEGVPKSWEKFNITNNGPGENTFLYMLLIWEFALNKHVLASCLWETDTIEQVLIQKPKYINWEYKLEHEYVIKENYVRQNLGFEKAESPIIYQQDKPINRTPLDKIGLFRIDTFKELADLLKVGFSDSTNMSNFYLTENPNSIIEILTSKKKPKLDKLLCNSDIFIGLLMGEDLGYYDYVFLASKLDLSNFLNATLDKINRFTKDYVKYIKKVDTVEEMLKLIDSRLKDNALQQ